jgi:hypothetical protein
MKRLYEGVTITSLLFFLIIVAGGAFVGVKSHVEKSHHDKKASKKLNKMQQEKDAYHLNKNKEDQQELEHLRHLNDPLYISYDEDGNKILR